MEYTIADGPKTSFNCFTEVLVLCHSESFCNQLQVKEYLVLCLTIQSYLTRQCDCHGCSEAAIGVCKLTEADHDSVLNTTEYVDEQ